MRSLHNYIKRQKGFTIVELLIVIVIIGILATLVIVTFSGIQQRARDTQRQTDINAIQSQVEAYYAQTGNYPTLEMITNDAFRNANMKGFPVDALTAPNSSAAISAAAATTSKYQYQTWADSTVPTGSDTGTACTMYDKDGNATTTIATTTTSNCQSYQITAVLENGGTDYKKSSN